MADISEVYRNLTGVDIEKQRLLWDERGKGYYGEYLVFKELYPKLTGCCKILMNVQVPTGDGRTTEIDLLLIHETGLYVFEMKHYKGTIYGKTSDQKWTQYFRTSPNSHFYNPVLQNHYHIKALQKMFPNTPIHSLIVFTSPECDLRVECKETDITVCQLGNLHTALRPLETRNKLFDSNRIDEIFNALLTFSPVTTTAVAVDGESIPFYQYINTIIKDYQNEKDRAKSTYLATEKLERRKTRITIIAAIVAVAVCIALSVFACFRYRTYADSQVAAAEAYADGQIAAAQKTLREFAQKFEHVAAFNHGDLAFSDNLIMVSDVVLAPSSDIANTTVVSCKLTHTGTDYGIFTNQDTAITIILKDGTVKECKVFNEKYPYSSDFYMGDSWTKESSILPHEFYNTAIGDIAYIKLTNVGVWTYVQHHREIISTSYEIEIYNAE